ncbi:succinylglutamate desuccinylase/aspartoacylase family protein [Microvirga sp. M2]|uniref:succinylglutamate desuccinylase/aspartoacylase family protein n=1 Tax=Microvirga sp. M2 TaxID=3073270 RepID=UPI0039C34BF7
MTLPGLKAQAVGTAPFEPGRLTTGELTLAHQIDGPVTAPIMIATGAGPGPILWVQAAIHGGEIGGTLGIARCLERLDLQTMPGAIVGALAANPLAFRTQTRNTPVDGENMNRLFPGAANGTITRQMALALMETAMASADIVMDLHSGGHEAIVPFYSLYWEDGSDASQKARAYARSAATDVVWAARDEWLSGAMFTQLTRRGVPALIVECGGAGISEAHIESFAQAIEGVARAAGILPGGAVRQERYRTIGSCDLAYTRHGGFFIPACEAGGTLEQGREVGRVVDVYGRTQETIVTPKRAYIAAVGRPYLPVQSGAMVAELNDDHGWG